MQSKRIEIKLINPNDEQPRGAVDPDTVANYAEQMKDGTIFKEIDVFEGGSDRLFKYHISSGWHRFRAHIKNGEEWIDAVIHKGDAGDALDHGFGCNIHGRALTNSEKNIMLKKLFGRPKFTSWTAKEIAKYCGVSIRFVEKVKTELGLTDRTVRSLSSETAGMLNSSSATEQEDGATSEDSDDDMPSDWDSPMGADDFPQGVGDPPEETDEEFFERNVKTNNKPKNGSVTPNKKMLFRECEKAFGQLFRFSLKLGVDEKKYGPHFEAIIKEINRIGGKV